MEIERIPLVDPRETYAYLITIITLTLMTTPYSDSWIRKKYSSVRDIIGISLAVFKPSDILN